MIIALFVVIVSTSDGSIVWATGLWAKIVYVLNGISGVGGLREKCPKNQEFVLYLYFIVTFILKFPGILASISENKEFQRVIRFPFHSLALERDLGCENIYNITISRKIKKSATYDICLLEDPYNLEVFTKPKQSKRFLDQLGGIRELN